jgi:hypothetical protein
MASIAQRVSRIALPPCLAGQPRGNLAIFLVMVIRHDALGAPRLAEILVERSCRHSTGQPPEP